MKGEGQEDRNKEEKGGEGRGVAEKGEGAEEEEVGEDREMAGKGEEV